MGDHHLCEAKGQGVHPQGCMEQQVDTRKEMDGRGPQPCKHRIRSRYVPPDLPVPRGIPDCHRSLQEPHCLVRQRSWKPQICHALHGYQHTQFTPISKKRVMYETISDGCQHNRNNWDSTVLKFRTSKFVRLPIVDVAPVKQGKTSEFCLEMGSVCFV